MLIEKRSFKEDQNIEISHNQDTNLKNEFIKGHYSQTGTSMTYKLYLETLLYVINFLFDPRIENGTFRKQQLETKVACCQDDNFRSYLDSSISYDCHALLINTCICMQSACLGATIVSLLLLINSVLFLLCYE